MAVAVAVAVPCLSTRSMTPQHLIGVGGPVTPLTEPEVTKTHKKGLRRRRRNRKDRCSGGGGGGGGDGGGGGGGGGRCRGRDGRDQGIEQALRLKISK